MEAKQYSLCEEVLRRLHDAGVLDGMVVYASLPTKWRRTINASLSDTGHADLIPGEDRI